MAKKPDTPCAGGCGTLLWSGGTSLPAGERTCRPCRRAGRGPSRATERPTKACQICGAQFYPGGPLQLTCSRQCGATSRLAKLDTMARPSRPCGGCGTTVTWPRIYCPPCASVRRSEHNQRKNLRRRTGGTVQLQLVV